MKELLDIPIEKNLKVMTSDDQSTFIILSDNPDRRLTAADISGMSTSTVVNVIPFSSRK